MRREEDSESESREYEEETEEDGETEENTDEDGSQDLEKKVITAPEQVTVDFNFQTYALLFDFQT